jgi:hypothetical protein
MNQAYRRLSRDVLLALSGRRVTGGLQSGVRYVVSQLHQEAVILVNTRLGYHLYHYSSAELPTLVKFPL